MPAKRTSNAAKNRRRSQGARHPERALQGTSADIVGVVLAVLAVALLAALLVPSSAVVTSATRDLMALSFGVAAPLVPVAIFVFATTFFLGDDEPVSGRVALGLSLIVLAVLGMVSLNQPGAEADAYLVLRPAVARVAGG